MIGLCVWISAFRNDRRVNSHYLAKKWCENNKLKTGFDGKIVWNLFSTIAFSSRNSIQLNFHSHLNTKIEQWISQWYSKRSIKVNQKCACAFNFGFMKWWSLSRISIDQTNANENVSVKSFCIRQIVCWSDFPLNFPRFRPSFECYFRDFRQFCRWILFLSPRIAR